MNDGDLGMVDLVKATNVLLSKWVISAFELGDFNLQNFIRFLKASSLVLKNLRNFQKGGKWAIDLQWCVQVNYKRAFGLIVWNRVGWAWDGK
jgi:hypothetical protein